jgi:hypothetical protein
MATRRYVSEWNRAVGDNIRVTADRLRARGLRVGVLPHKTTLLIERPNAMNWPTFKAAVRAELQLGRGSVVIFSESTGKTFICQNRGNQPGHFQRV